jgi:indolepyruvate decarboxylase
VVLATTERIRAGYFIYEGVTMKDFMEALLARFKQTKGYPLKTVAPPQPAYPEPWASNSDPHWNDKPETITYNRFFQHSLKFLHDHRMLDQIVMTYGVSSSLYVATNAYGLSQNSFIGSAAWQCIGFETGAASGAQLGSGKRAWTVAGDGGFMMVCQSLSTLARNKLNAVTRDQQHGLRHRAGLCRPHRVRAGARAQVRYVRYPAEMGLSGAGKGLRRQGFSR